MAGEVLGEPASGVGCGQVARVVIGVAAEQHGGAAQGGPPEFGEVLPAKMHALFDCHRDGGQVPSPQGLGGGADVSFRAGQLPIPGVINYSA